MRKKIWMGAGSVMALAVTAVAIIPTEPAGYSAKSAAAKQALLLELNEQQRYTGVLPTASANGWDFLAATTNRFLHLTFLHDADFFPQGRKKVIHPYGSVAGVEWVAEPGVPYTGFFQTGGVGVARLSRTAMDGNFAPGVSLKMLVDGQTSVNFLTGKSLDGSATNFEFFDFDLSNILPNPHNPALILGQLIFKKALWTLPSPPENELTLPLHEAASIHGDGTRVANPIVPHEMVLLPTQQAKDAWDAAPQSDDFRDRLVAIPAGTPLYRVVVRERDGMFVSAGYLRSTSEFIASAFGDKQLFFKHQRKVFR